VKVALISHEGGGISSVSRSLSERLSSRKIHTVVFTTTKSRIFHVQRINDYLKIARFPVPNVPPRSFLFQSLHNNCLIGLLKKFTIIHGMSPDASFALSGQMKKVGKPFVSSIHGDPRAGQRVFFHQPLPTWSPKEIGFYVFEFPLHDYAISKVLENSGHTIVCSKTALENLRSYKNLNLQRTSVIYNGIDIRDIESRKIESNAENKNLSIVYAGRLFWAKGIMHLLAAFKMLMETNKDVQLKVFGQGPLRESIEKFIIHSGLKENVQLLGQVSHSKLLSEIHRATVVAFPSLQEAQSMFMLEAMACRKPVVAFDYPFAREIVSSGFSGLLANPGDVQDLCVKIQLLLSDEGFRTRIGENAFNYVKNKHDLDSVTDAHIDIYERVTAN
jgi:glycosyltransferase involved in cell wall biosynthesis